MITDPIPNFPFVVITIGATGRLAKVTIVKRTQWSKTVFQTDTGRYLNAESVFLKEADAWEAGAQRLADRQARITKLQDKLEKDRTAFAKARSK